MKFRTGLSIAAIFTMALALPAAAATDQEVARGLKIAEENCAVCHAIGKEGDSQHPAAPPFRTLSSRYPVETLEEALAEGIVTGHPFMPEVELEPEEITDFIAYLRSIQADARP